MSHVLYARSPNHIGTGVLFFLQRHRGYSARSAVDQSFPVSGNSDKTISRRVLDHSLQDSLSVALSIDSKEGRELSGDESMTRQ